MAHIDYDRILPRSVVEMPSSGIRKFFDILDSMTDVTALTVGQPDFVTPWKIREAGIESLETGKTYYTSNAGTLELRQEISRYMARRFDLTYDPKTEVVVTVGGSEAIDVAMRTLLQPGDEVIIPTPCFVCYEPLCKLTGAIPVIVETRNEDKFKLTPELLESAITEKTKMLVLAYPNNPTGAIMDAEDLEKPHRPLSITVSKEGYQTVMLSSNCTLSTFGVLDLVGGFFLLVPWVGLLAPGAFTLDNQNFTYHLIPQK